jgi:hypothetical protein
MSHKGLRVAPCRYNDGTNPSQEPYRSRAPTLELKQKVYFSGWHSLFAFGLSRASFMRVSLHLQTFGRAALAKHASLA